MKAIIHPVQKEILKNLVYKPNARFRDLNTTELTNDQFTFHLKKLLQDGYVEKIEEGYKLTNKGLLYSSNLDLDSLEVPHIKVGVKLYIERRNGNEIEVLLGERLRDPFKGTIGFHTHKVRPDESVFETARRCLLNETGLTGEFEYAGLEYIIEKSEEALNSSRMMNFIRVKNIQGEMLEITKESKNTWVNIKDISKLENTYHDILEDFSLFQRKEMFFNEKVRK